MRGFLEDVVGSSYYEGATTSYNYDFFESYIDHELLVDLFQLSNKYTNIISLLKKRNDTEETNLLSKLSSELKELEEKINEIKTTQMDLCDDILGNVEFRKNAYQSETIDFKKINHLNTLNIRAERSLSESDIELEDLVTKRTHTNEERKQIVDKRAALDDDIERQNDELKELITNLNGKEIDIFKDVNIDSLEEEYKQGLEKIIQNSAAKEAYTSYVLDILKRENHHFQHLFSTAKDFISIANKENGFEVPELELKNEQIMMTESVTAIAKERLRLFGDIYCRNATDQDKLITKTANGYLQTKQFVDGIYDYIFNIEEFSKNIPAANESYFKLRNFNNLLHNKLAETIRGEGRNSLSKEAYELSIEMFDIFRVDLRKINAPETSKSNNHQANNDNHIDPESQYKTR